MAGVVGKKTTNQLPQVKPLHQLPPVKPLQAKLLHQGTGTTGELLLQLRVELLRMRLLHQLPQAQLLAVELRLLTSQ
jgi:hypothetical protein